ncbi:MAG: UDP-N-acetylmuramoyl-tripeptide--D-alanyl-D-alanine ligase [Bacteroidota bacterium]
MNLTLSDFIKIRNAHLFGTDKLQRKICSGVSTDSRKIENGNLFFALKGENFDGHKFLNDVVKKNIYASVINKDWFDAHKEECENLNTTLIIVPNSTIAYGELANIYRKKFSLPIIAIGGSNGKTTTKEMIREVLETKYNVLATIGNLNNHIGVPQMLFDLNQKHEIAILELGTNHPGELKYLCEIVEPTHAVVTNIGREHLEFFKNLNGVMKEEKTIFDSVAEDGFAFVNSDDNYILKSINNNKNKIFYGKKSSNNFIASEININKDGNASFKITNRETNKNQKVNLKISGLHNVANALSSVAVGQTFGVSLKKCAEVLENFSAPQKRMELISHKGITIINDSYNANPDSMLSALKTLESFQSKGRKIAVLGDMFELGSASKTEHENIGLSINKMGIDFIFGVGKFTKRTILNIRNKEAKYFFSKKELVKYLKKFVKKNDVMLIKGSRGMKMEEVIDGIFSKGK